VDRDASVNAVVLTGAGKVFSAGGDFAMIQQNIDDFGSRARQWKEARDIVYNVINCSKPWSARCAGFPSAPVSFVVSSPIFRLRPKDCRIIDGHTRLGVAAGDHAAIVWPLLCGLAKAKYYLLLCDQILGEEAERIGLISLAVEDAELDAKAVEIATRLAEGAQSAIRWTKYALNNWLRAMGPTFDGVAGARVLRFSGPEVKEGLASHLEKRKPAFPPAPPL